MGDFDIKDGVLLKYSGRDRDVIVPEGTVAIGEGAFKDNDSFLRRQMVREAPQACGLAE